MLMGCSSIAPNPHPTPKTSEESTESSPSEESSETPKSYKVLFIGNSFTYYNDLDKVTEEIGKSIGVDITCDRVAIGAHKLIEFATDGDDGANQIAQKVNNNDYTHIIIQEQSTLPLSNYSQFLDGATKLVGQLKEKEPNAEIRLYQSWGYQNMVDAKYGNTIAECENKVCDAYKKVGKALDLKIHYVGKAFTKWLNDNPDVSPYYSKDNKHPSFLGTYISGLMHVASLTGKNLSGVTYQGEQGKYNDYGETYINDTNKTKAINLANYIYQTYGINY